MKGASQYITLHPRKTDTLAREERGIAVELPVDNVPEKWSIRRQSCFVFHKTLDFFQKI
jgi:hypothetical protein